MSRIFIADDSACIRRGLRCLLETHPDWEICGEANNGREAVSKVRKLAPDLAILDFSMPFLNGLEAGKQIASTCPGVRTLLCTIHVSKELVNKARDAGLNGATGKSEPKRLMRMVEALLRKGSAAFQS